MCLFAIQAVVCGNISGNTSDPIHVYSKEILESGADTAYIASIVFLVSAVIVCIAVSIAVIIIVSKET